MNIPQDLIDAFKAAKDVVVLTGAGISAESGIPTFREAQTGLWNKYDPSELATPQAFKKNPKLVWDWYDWRKSIINNAKPNSAHYALVKLEKLVNSFTLITQNIDNLHSEAGSQKVIELHGNIFRTKCFDENTIVEKWKNNKENPPQCPNCGGLLRPDVVWFNENLNSEILMEAILNAKESDVFLSIGTSSLVYPAAGLPFSALENKSLLVEINPTSTPITNSMHYVIQGPAGVILPELVESLTT